MLIDHDFRDAVEYANKCIDCWDCRQCCYFYCCDEIIALNKKFIDKRDEEPL